MATRSETADAIERALPELQAERCPAAFYHALNAAGGIHRDTVTGNFVVTRYDLLRKIVSDPATFSSNTGLTIERDTPIRDRVREMYATQAWPAKHVLLTNDPPEHRIYRSLVDKIWSPGRVAALHDYIEELVEQAIDRFVDRGEAELISEFAGTFPVIIAIDFLGLPRTDAAQVLRWTRAAISIIDNRFDEATELAAHTQIIALLQYVKAAGDEAAREPSDSFISALRNVEINGQKLTEQEFVWLVELLLVGGHDSITLAIGSAMIALIEQPALQAELGAHPEKIDAFVEELLRVDGPVKATHRRVTTDTDLDGVTLPAGSIIQMQWAGANHDEARLADSGGSIWRARMPAGTCRSARASTSASATSSPARRSASR